MCADGVTGYAEPIKNTQLVKQPYSVIVFKVQLRRLSLEI